jgi:TRAP-type C4-dicarboxylate transport system permease small subunit
MAAIVAIMVLVTVDVLLRNVLGTSITGTLEVSEFLQGVAVFLGLAATLRSGSHISADLLVDRLSKRKQAGVDLFTNIVSLAIFALMTYALFVVATGPGAADEISEMVGIPSQPFKLLAAFGVGMMCLEIVRLIARCAAVLAGGRK